MVKAGQKASLVRAGKFTLVVTFAYLFGSLSASVPLFALGIGRWADPFGVVGMVGTLALPFVLVVKLLMYAEGWDGVWHHAAAGLFVGAFAVMLVFEADDFLTIGAFAIAGMCGAMAYLGTRNLGRRVVRW